MPAVVQYVIGGVWEMYLIFFVVWIIFNGKFTWEIAAFGAVFSGVMYFFMCRFLNYGPKKDLTLCRRFFGMLHYIFVLVKEIVKANMTVVKMICSAKYVPEPVIVQFRTDLKTEFARVMLADSITLTPGTITVYMSDGVYLVHCLDKSLAEGLDCSVFVELLRKLERTD